MKLGEFESVDLPAQAFDLVAAATSFHWISPQQGLDRVAGTLRPGGWVALWWNHYGDPDQQDPFREAVQPLLQRHAPHLSDENSAGAGIGAHPYALDTRSRTDEIDNCGRFGSVQHVVIPWTMSQTAHEMRRFLNSFSSWMALNPDVRSLLLRAIGDLIDARFGGAVDRPFLTAIYTAQRI